MEEMTPDYEPTEIKDFSKPKKAIRFRIDDSFVFEARAKLPSFALLRFSDKVEQFEKGTTDEQLQAVEDIFSMILTPESATRFIDRMNGKVDPAIDVQDIQVIIPWLFEQYGGRPTSPSEQSSDGSGNQGSGTSSTESVPSTESISVDYRSIGS